MSSDYDLTKLKCVPCEGGIPALKPEGYRDFLNVVPNWQVKENKKIERQFNFKNFRSALNFVNQVGELAETEGHHPDIIIHDWNQVKLMLTTHTINGLSINDFILASKIDLLKNNLPN